MISASDRVRGGVEWSHRYVDLEEKSPVYLFTRSDEVYLGCTSRVTFQMYALPKMMLLLNKARTELLRALLGAERTSVEKKQEEPKIRSCYLLLVSHCCNIPKEKYMS